MNKTNHLIVGPISFNSKIKKLKPHKFLCKANVYSRAGRFENATKKTETNKHHLKSIII